MRSGYRRAWTGRVASGVLARHKRDEANTELSELNELIVELDDRHDSKARSAHHHCDGLIEGTDDPEDTAEYEGIKRKLFPGGLKVVPLPYVEEGGAAVVLLRSLTIEMRAKLDAIVVGKQTLGQLVDAWIEAGHALGKAVDQRSKLRAALRRGGSASAKLDVRKGRGLWMQAVKGLLWAIGAEDELEPLREPVEAVLREAIDLALERRNAKAAAKGKGGVEKVADEVPVAERQQAASEPGNEDEDQDQDAG